VTLFSPPPDNGELFALIDVKRGDAGKAKILIDLLASGRIQLMCKPIGGAGSGRTAYIDGQKLVFAQLPEGIAFEDVTAVIGSLAFVYPDAFQFSPLSFTGHLFNGKTGLIQEMERFRSQGFLRGELVISPRAALGLPWHLSQDMLEEIIRMPDDIGTTVNGMGPIASTYFGRNGLRMGDLLASESDLRRRFLSAYRIGSAVIGGLTHDAQARIKRDFDGETLKKIAGRFCGWNESNGRTFLEAVDELHSVTPQEFLGGSEDELFAWLLNVQRELKQYVRDIDELVAENRRRKEGMAVVATNGRKLHPVFGDYPMVTTSLISIPSILELSGLPASAVTKDNAHVIAAIKAYDSHVGEGVFPTELFDDVGEGIRQKGHEFGTVSGRPRRVGWLDLVSSRTGMLNMDINELSVTRLDILSGQSELKVCVAYEYQGRRLEVLPADVPIEECTPIYVTVAGWSEDIYGVTSLSQLPPAALEYLRAIQKALGCKITHVGTGPEVNQCIICDGV